MENTIRGITNQKVNKIRKCKRVDISRKIMGKYQSKMHNRKLRKIQAREIQTGKAKSITLENISRKIQFVKYKSDEHKSENTTRNIQIGKTN